MLIECDRAEPTGAPNDVLSAKRISLEGGALPIALARRNSDACQSRGRGWRRSRADLPAQVGRFPGARSSRRLGYGQVGVRRVPRAPARRSISATGNPGGRTPFQASPDLASTRSRGCCWPAMSQASGTRVPRYRHLLPARFPTAPVSICRASPTELPGTLPTISSRSAAVRFSPSRRSEGPGICAAPNLEFCAAFPGSTWTTGRGGGLHPGGTSWSEMLRIIRAIDTMLPHGNPVSPIYRSVGYTQGGSQDPETLAGKIGDLTAMLQDFDRLDLAGTRAAPLCYYLGIAAPRSDARSMDISNLGTYAFCRANAPGAGGRWSGRVFATTPWYQWPFGGSDNIHTDAYGTVRHGEFEGYAKYIAEDEEPGRFTPLWNSLSRPVVVTRQTITVPFDRPSGAAFARGVLTWLADPSDGIARAPAFRWAVRRNKTFLPYRPACAGWRLICRLASRCGPVTWSRSPTRFTVRAVLIRARTAGSGKPGHGRTGQPISSRQTGQRLGVAIHEEPDDLIAPGAKRESAHVHLGNPRGLPGCERCIQAAKAGDAEDGGAVVADGPAREADQDRREGRQPRPLRHVPNGRGGGAAREMFADILSLIARLRVLPAPA